MCEIREEREMSFGIAVGITKDEESSPINVWVALRTGEGVGLPPETARMVATQLLIAAELVESRRDGTEEE